MADGSVMVLDQAKGNGWHLWNADSIEVLRGLPENSIGYSMFSPPFASLYTFSDSPRDVSNNADDRVFWQHYRFIAEGLFRAMMPGRSVSIHCMDLPTSKTRDGYIGLRDFPAMNRQLFEDVGFIFHSRAMVRKDPVSAMQRTKAIGLLHKQVAKDSAISRMAIPDFVITLRKPGDNPEPIAGLFDVYHGDDISDAELEAGARATWDPSGTRSFTEHKSILIWQRYAEPIWLDIAQSDVLSRIAARDEADERHISPLQLTLIRRCLQMWTNRGDVVFSPFAGIGSVGYVAIEMGRRFCGAELKPSYFRQAAANLGAAEEALLAGTLFDRPYSPEADAIGSYNAAVTAGGEKVKAGDPMPDFFRSTRESSS